MITEGGRLGHYAWLSAYHETLLPGISDLPIRSGAIQQAVGLDFSQGLDSVIALKLSYSIFNLLVYFY